MKIIDTHLHVWDLNEFRLPWLDGCGEVLNRTYVEADYLKEFEKNKKYELDQAVYIEVDVRADQKKKEAAFLLEKAADKTSVISGGVISGDLTDPEFPAYLDQFQSGALKGIRQVLHVDDAAPGTCLKPEFIRGIKELGARGLVFEACMRIEELDDLYQMAKLCPETTIIMDHMGNIDAQRVTQNTGDSQYAEQWMTDVKNIASCENVICKVSGLNPEGVWNVQTLKPAVDIVLDAFGEDKVIYASNYPVCNSSTEMIPWIEALDEITKNRGEVFRRKLFYENAKIIYNL